MNVQDISLAINAVFDEYPQAAINLPALVSLVLAKTGTIPQNVNKDSVQVKNWIRSHKKEFSINTGRNGGVRRRADFPIPITPDIKPSRVLKSINLYLNRMPKRSRVTFPELVMTIQEKYPRTSTKIVDALAHEAVYTRKDLIVRKGHGIVKLD